MLRFGLNSFSQEIIECVGSISRFDKEVEVKRGCIFVIYLLLVGLGVEALQIVPEHFTMIKEIINRYLTDSDGVTFFHAENARASLREIISYQTPQVDSILHIIKH